MVSILFISWEAGDKKKKSYINSQILGEFWYDILG
ncbi:uncharacterized protein (DUF608 family) [Sulfurisphaera ohwakuensis]|uniref:Uncharacterized protein (DUF608 family) n=1 Tax=Sulfurisphaera ohwakuensis TaxID=69656 RepID=A0A7J9RVT3_SULOH|nr:uncharacterized protein (DUF608 family) [Sulfurisphaera ohwakuensis]